MHTWYYRLNALFTVATTVLAILCALASMTEIIHKSEPVVAAQLVRVDTLSVSGHFWRFVVFGQALRLVCQTAQSSKLSFTERERKRQSLANSEHRRRPAQHVQLEHKAGAAPRPYSITPTSLPGRI